MRTDDHGCWVLVAPRSRLPQLDPLVELRSASRPVRVIARDDPPVADEWARLVPGGAAGVLLVGDRRRSPGRVTERPFVRAADGGWVPVGWLPAARDLSAYVGAAAAVSGRRDRSPVAVLGQRSPRYQKLSERLVHHLGDLPSLRWGAERMTREDLVAGLGLGLGVAVYLGHGRPSGWAAYRGMRAAHLSGLSSPLGALLSLTCWTASRRGVGTSFSEQVVLQGTATAAVGAIRPVLHLDNTRIVVALAAALRGPAPDVATLLRAMLLAGGAPTAEASSYRLIGDPLASLSGAENVLSRAGAVFAPAPDQLPTPLEAVR